MIEIDGSMGEGGGQLLRYSVALSVLLGKNLKIYNIRAKRSNPGLRPQHLTAVKTIASLAKAEVEGLKIGSKVVVIKPRQKPKGGKLSIDIGTAGSISLLLQAILPVLFFAKENSEVVIKGGTTVKWAPPVPYMQHVLVKLLKFFGAHAEIELIRRGFYPRGGGIVKARVFKIDFLRSVNMKQFSFAKEIRGISYVANLPVHIAKRQAIAAENVLRKTFPQIPLRIDIDHHTPAIGKGTGIVLWAVTDQGILGADAIGEIGKRAEVVGEEAAKKLTDELKMRAAVDEHALDNLIIYMSLAEGRSRIYARRLTSHAETALKLCKTITGANYKIEKANDGVIVEIEGIGLKSF